MTKDGADLHVERWRDHWVLDKGFDDDVEAMTVRIGTIQKWFKTTTKDAVATVGLQDFEYDTLHALMIRDTPGRASPGELAQEMGVSNAGVTGRLDEHGEEGLAQADARAPPTGAGSRSRRPARGSDSGARPWPCAAPPSTTSARPSPSEELATLNELLKKMTLYIEAREVRCFGVARCGPLAGLAPPPSWRAKRALRAERARPAIGSGGRGDCEAPRSGASVAVDPGRAREGRHTEGPRTVRSGALLRTLGGSVDHSGLEPSTVPLRTFLLLASYW